MYTVYSINNCVYCEKAKEVLKSHGKIFTEIPNVKGKDTGEIMELVDKTGCSTFPQIFIGNTFIGGYDQLVDAIDF